VSATTTVDARPLGDRFGAEVVGLDPVDTLGCGELEHLRDLLVRHKVLGRRGQHLDAEAQRRFVARFGADAHRFVNTKQHRHLRLRGLNAKVVVPGTVSAGDAIRKL